MRRPFPGSSALRASTCGLKNDDPSGAAPLRDRQAVAAGEGSTTGNSLMGYEAVREGVKKRAEGEGIALGSLHKRDRTARGGQ